MRASCRNASWRNTCTVRTVKMASPCLPPPLPSYDSRALRNEKTSHRRRHNRSAEAAGFDLLGIERSHVVVLELVPCALRVCECVRVRVSVFLCVCCPRTLPPQSPVRAKKKKHEINVHISKRLRACVLLSTYNLYFVLGTGLYFSKNRDGQKQKPEQGKKI